MGTISRRVLLQSSAMAFLAPVAFAGCRNGLTAPSALVQGAAAFPSIPASPYDLVRIGTAGQVAAYRTTGEEALIDALAPTPEQLEDGDGLDLGLDFEFVDSSRPTIHSEWNQQFPGFFVYIDRVETHPLSPCVTVPVKHFHIIVKRRSSTPDNQAWTKLHVGTYTSGRSKCYVLFDSQNKWVCLPTCSRPSRSDLSSVILGVLTAATLAAGLTITAAALIAASEVVATAALPLMLAL